MIRQIQEANEKINANVELLKALKKLIPNAIGKDGSIDVDTIRYWAQKATGDKSLVTEERETFNFLGKDYARLLYSLDTETVIVPDKENNKKSENKDSENLYLSGDNLEVLKHLRRSYEGQVKCIYIDPPYNTGSDDFVYNDSFDFSEKDIEEKLGINSDSESAKRIHKMISRKSSRSHAAWLTFMYPRLKLARDLMKDDGVIFISIDDNEQANLKILCDEIFGEENFCGNLIIETATDNNARQISTDHEYMLC
ncbi:DNA methylase [Fibrobacter sp. UWEL]|nr:site-specific DNA-methyltransferase [Fibrobacter sp. UWEL]SHL01978.1 DNA methylase [Fibrobacter sp. UWEL]